MAALKENSCMAKSEKKQKRFVKIFSEGAFGSMEIFVDTETGVNYLYRCSGYAGGLCPLLDAEGNPVISEEYRRKNEFSEYKF